MLTSTQLRTVAERHGLPFERMTQPEVPGTVSGVYFFGDSHVLRVATDENGVARFAKEARIIPLAREAGVHTPALLNEGFLDGPSPIPYMMLERDPGDNLGVLGLEPSATPDAYRALGRDLALWHIRAVAEDDPLRNLERDAHPDPRSALPALVEQGYLAEDGARWVHAWLDQLAPSALVPHVWRVVHGDARPTNVQVNHDLSYRALLDWGDAQWADPASEFALMPLRAVPYALEGYREVRTDSHDEVNEARILWYDLAWAVLSLNREPRPAEKTWSAPPAGRLLEWFRFITEQPERPWRSLLPKRS
jgi:hygromycin-B 7''-O-kinase